MPAGWLNFITMETANAKIWIDRLGLEPHPEGGYYKEVFRSDCLVQRSPGIPARTACTSIYYLLEGEDYSGFHRLASDEIWYFHTGEPLHIHWIDAEGQPRIHELSAETGGMLSMAIPPGTWFAAELPGKKGFSLCSCAVAPGFEFSEFEMGEKEKMTAAFPAAADIIARLSR